MTIRVRAKHDLPHTFHDAFGPIRVGMVGTIVSEVGTDVLSVAFSGDDPNCAYPQLVYRRDFDVLEEHDQGPSATR